jgi:hypothetical protein
LRLDTRSARAGRNGYETLSAQSGQCPPLCCRSCRWQLRCLGVPPPNGCRWRWWTRGPGVAAP